MPKPNGKARWAENTIDAAKMTAKTIMGRASLGRITPWSRYYYAGLHAAVVLQSAIELVDAVENNTRDGSV
jgi:hypothetical protein